jgi:hypothetical protein
VGFAGAAADALIDGRAEARSARPVEVGSG